MERLTDKNLLLALITLTVTLAGCGSEAPETNSSAARKTPVAGAAAGAKAAQRSKDMVSAVSVGKPGAPVDMHFELGSRPAVGQPLTVTIELTPRSAFGSLQATVQANDGIALTTSGELEAADAPTLDAPVTRTITVTPLREGVFYLSVFVYADEASSSSSRSFAIPIVVGDGAVANAANKPVTTTDSTNERVESMPAQEKTRTP